jgi:hypothetical protein
MVYNEIRVLELRSVPCSVLGFAPPAMSLLQFPSSRLIAIAPGALNGPLRRLLEFGGPLMLCLIGLITPAWGDEGVVPPDLASSRLEVVGGAAPFGPSGPSFQLDVMAVLSKAGCNLGVCHGNKNGKGGFKLSLRGEDPAWDLHVLTREQQARRINLLAPDASLILRKALLETPHEGGRRFRPHDPEARVLREWIAHGACDDAGTIATPVSLRVEPASRVVVEPETTVTLQAVATFSDGSTRDVTRFTVFEPAQPIVAISPVGEVRALRSGETTVVARYLTVQAPARLAFIPDRPMVTDLVPQFTNVVDREVFGRLRELRIEPAPLTTDGEFIRRLSLDLLGVLPTAAEARQFVADSSPIKRDQLIDQWLERPEFADFWAQKWGDLLRNEERTLDRKGVQNFHAWLRRGIEIDKPLDELARELLAARGSTYTQPETNYLRALRDPIERAETSAQLFLGVRLQCAKCHSHPFDRWTQDDYYRWAAVFARVDYRILENRRTDSNDTHEFDGEQLVLHAARGEVNDPRSGKPAPPRLLGGPEIPSGVDRLDAAAEWLGNRANDRFIEAQVNRIWFHLLGRGLVDLRSTNPPSHPALLRELARQFVADGCRLKPLVRLICQSRTYQLSSRTNASNASDETAFSRAHPQRLAAEVLLDALASATAAPLSFAGYSPGFRAGELPGVRGLRERDRGHTPHDQFLKVFGKPPRLQSCECERSNEPTLSQTLQLVTGEVVAGLIETPDNRLGTWLREGRSSSHIVDELFWTCLQRGPTAEEQAGFKRHLEAGPDRRGALEDLCWSLLNSREFQTRR